jgi:uncharacterized protein (TIGR02466 family)
MSKKPAGAGSRKFTYRRDDGPKGRAELLFATPLLNRRLAIATPDFLAEVKAHVLDLMAKDTGVKRSNVGGWHSSGDLFATEDATMQALAEALLASAAEMTYYRARDFNPQCTIEVDFEGAAWANVSREGDFNRPHIHPGFVWSGVFYVDTGPGLPRGDPKAAEAGNIEFVDPRPGNHHSIKHVVRPRAGQVLIFPAWLSHYVNPYRGRGERVSIAFNVAAKVSRPDGA